MHINKVAALLLPPPPGIVHMLYSARWAGVRLLSPSLLWKASSHLGLAAQAPAFPGLLAPAISGCLRAWALCRWRWWEGR